MTDLGLIKAWHKAAAPRAGGSGSPHTCPHIPVPAPAPVFWGHFMSFNTQIERAVKSLQEFRSCFAPNRQKPTKDTDANAHTMQEPSTRDSSRSARTEFCILCHKNPLPGRHLNQKHLPRLSSCPCGAKQPPEGWVSPAQLSLPTHQTTLAPGSLLPKPNFTLQV